MHKTVFDKLKNGGLIESYENHIHTLVNKLLHNLKKPSDSDSSCFIPDFQRIKNFKINKKEPANWAHLNCAGVHESAEKWIITIEEASPDHCPTLCGYIQRYMTAWGWDVIVETEW